MRDAPVRATFVMHGEAFLTANTLHSTRGLPDMMITQHTALVARSRAELSLVSARFNASALPVGMRLDLGPTPPRWLVPCGKRARVRGCCVRCPGKAPDEALAALCCLSRHPTQQHCCRHHSTPHKAFVGGARARVGRRPAVRPGTRAREAASDPRERGLGAGRH